MGIVKMYPKAWRTDVIVIRGGGRDNKGNPLPTQEISVRDCIVGARATAEPLDHSDVVDSKAVLYRDLDPGFSFLSTDRVRIPAGKNMAGDWSVEGRPGEWPLGVEVGLVRA